MPRTIILNVGIPLILAGIIAVAFFPFWTGKVIYEDDAAYYFLPAFKFYGDALKRGESPAVAPAIMAGFPLSLSQVGGFSDPLNYFIFKNFQFPFAYHFRVFLNYWLAAFLTYLFCRALGLNRVAALIGALGYITAQNIIPGMSIHRSNSFFLMPGLFYAFQRLSEVELPRYGRAAFIVLGALIFAISFLGGYTQLSFYAALAALSYAGFLFIRRKSWAFALSAFLIFVLGALVFLPHLLKVAEYLPLTARSGGLDWATARGSGDLGLLLKNLTLYLIIPPLHFGTTQSLYTGSLTALFAVYAFLLVRRDRLIAFFAALFGFAALSSFSYPLFWAMHKLPVFSYFRFPPHWLFVASFALSILAALCYHILASSKGGFSATGLLQSKYAKAVVLPIAVFNFILAVLLAAEKKAVPYNAISATPWIVERIRTQEMGNAEPFRGHIFYPGDQLWFGFIKPFNPSVEKIIELKRDFAWPLQSPLFFGVETVAAQDYFTSRRYQKLSDYIYREGEIADYFNQASITLEIPARKFEVLGMMNVKYVWSNVPFTPSLESVVTPLEWKVLDPYPIPLILYRNEKFIPRVFAPRAVEVLPVSDESYARITKTGAEPFDSLSFVECGECEHRRIDNPLVKIDLNRRSNTRWELAVEAEDDAWIIVSNQLLPRWKAFIDGAETKLYYANFVFQGFRVPRGAHEVSLKYD